MLPDAVPLTDDDAERWSAAGTPRWWTRQLPATLWLLAFVVAVATDNTHCTPADPRVCGPDQAFAWFMVIALATPVLFFWMPLLACAAGVLYALGELRYDPAAAPRLAFATHGVLCLVIAALLLLSRRAQQQALASQATSMRLSARDLRVSWSPVRAGLVVLMVPVAATSFWWYQHVSAAESRHVSRSEMVTAQVVASNSDDSTITVEVDEGLNDRRELVMDVIDTHDYPVAGATPVLLDPLDPHWKRLVAEPYDPTGWESLGFGALALMALLTGRHLQRRRAIQGIAAAPQACVQVGMAERWPQTLLFPEDSDARPFGVLRVQQPRPDEHLDNPDHLLRGPEELDGLDDLDDLDSTAFGQLWRDERPMDGFAWDDAEGLVDVPAFETGGVRPAVLVGALYDGGWAILVTPDRVLVPTRPLRVHNRSRRWADLLAKAPRPFKRTPEPVSERGLPGVPVPAGEEAAPVAVPSLAHPPAARRHLGKLFCGAAFLAAPCGVWLADGWYQRAIAVLLGGQLLLNGCRRTWQQLRLTHNQLEVVGPWTTRQIPWSRLHGARLDGEILLLAWEPDFVIALGPLELEGSGADPLTVAQTVGATAVRMRERALAVGHVTGQVARVPGTARGVFFAYGLVSAVALWMSR